MLLLNIDINNGVKRLEILCTTVGYGTPWQGLVSSGTVRNSMARHGKALHGNTPQAHKTAEHGRARQGMKQQSTAQTIISVSLKLSTHRPSLPNRSAFRVTSIVHQISDCLFTYLLTLSNSAYLNHISRTMGTTIDVVEKLKVYSLSFFPNKLQSDKVHFVTTFE